MAYINNVSYRNADSHFSYVYSKVLHTHMVWYLNDPYTLELDNNKKLTNYQTKVQLCCFLQNFAGLWEFNISNMKQNQVYKTFPNLVCLTYKNWPTTKLKCNYVVSYKHFCTLFCISWGMLQSNFSNILCVRATFCRIMRIQYQ